MFFSIVTRSGKIYGFNHETVRLMLHGLTMLSIDFGFSIKNLVTYVSILCILNRRKVRRSEYTRRSAPRTFGSKNLSNLFFFLDIILATVIFVTLANDQRWSLRVATHSLDPGSCNWISRLFDYGGNLTQGSTAPCPCWPSKQIWDAHTTLAKCWVCFSDAAPSISLS